MARKLVGQNAVVQTTDLGLQDGVPATGTAVPLISLARSITIADSTDTADTSALGDTRKTTQVLRGATEITIELFVPATGAQFDGLIGHYFLVEYKELSTLGSFKTFNGVLTARTLEMPDGAQVERLTIMCDAN
jgi:hypothetical protein